MENEPFENQSNAPGPMAQQQSQPKKWGRYLAGFAVALVVVFISYFVVTQQGEEGAPSLFKAALTEVGAPTNDSFALFMPDNYHALAGDPVLLEVRAGSGLTDPISAISAIFNFPTSKITFADDPSTLVLTGTAFPSAGFPSVTVNAGQISISFLNASEVPLTSLTPGTVLFKLQGTLTSNVTPADSPININVETDPTLAGLQVENASGTVTTIDATDFGNGKITVDLPACSTVDPANNPDWNCTDYNTTINGCTAPPFESRICTRTTTQCDQGAALTGQLKDFQNQPDVRQICTCHIKNNIEPWTCGGFSNCEGGTRTRACTYKTAASWVVDQCEPRDVGTITPDKALYELQICGQLTGDIDGLILTLDEATVNNLKTNKPTQYSEAFAAAVVMINSSDAAGIPAVATLTVGGVPIGTTTVGTCVITFGSGADELDCADSVANIKNDNGGDSAATVATDIRSLINVTDAVQGPLVVGGAGSDAIFTAAAGLTGDINFSDSTGGDITNVATTGVTASTTTVLDIEGTPITLTFTGLVTDLESEKLENIAQNLADAINDTSTYNLGLTATPNTRMPGGTVDLPGLVLINTTTANNDNDVDIDQTFQAGNVSIFPFPVFGLTLLQTDNFGMQAVARFADNVSKLLTAPDEVTFAESNDRLSGADLTRGRLAAGANSGFSNVTASVVSEDPNTAELTTILSNTLTVNVPSGPVIEEAVRIGVGSIVRGGRVNLRVTVSDFHTISDIDEIFVDLIDANDPSRIFSSTGVVNDVVIEAEGEGDDVDAQGNVENFRTYNIPIDITPNSLMFDGPYNLEIIIRDTAGFTAKAVVPITIGAIVATGNVHDDDNVLNQLDVIDLYNFYTKKITLTPDQIAAGNMDGVGGITLADVILLYNLVISSQ